MDWANDPPPKRCRLSIDEVLTSLARRKRRPFIRSESAILAEFPTLDWDGPYRAARYYLFHFLMFGMDDTTKSHMREMRRAKADIKLLCDIQEFIHVYVDRNKKLANLGREYPELYRNFDGLKKAIRNAEFLEQCAQQSLREYQKGGRPPAYWKKEFVSRLAQLWRVMTGCVASTDLTSQFASFVSAAWTCLGDDLPETSWDTHIRRREGAPSATELVQSANLVRDTAITYFVVWYRPENFGEAPSDRCGGT